MHPLTLLSLAAGAVPALADTHYFYIGFFSGSAILGVEFDDVASSLTVVNNISTEAVSGQRWLAFDVGVVSDTSGSDSDPYTMCYSPDRRMSM